jgi:hypothetical protein
LKSGFIFESLCVFESFQLCSEKFIEFHRE